MNLEIQWAHWSPGHTGGLWLLINHPGFNANAAAVLASERELYHQHRDYRLIKHDKVQKASDRIEADPQSGIRYPEWTPGWWVGETTGFEPGNPRGLFGPGVYPKGHRWSDRCEQLKKFRRFTDAMAQTLTNRRQTNRGRFREILEEGDIITVSGPAEQEQHACPPPEVWRFVVQGNGRVEFIKPWKNP